MAATEGRGRVDKVVRLIGVSTLSWEDAARVAVADAAKTIRDLRIGRVIDLDLRVPPDGGPPLYRVGMEVSFRLDRMRATASGPVEVRRYLVVGNATLASAELDDAVRARCAAGPCEYHVVVPRTASPFGSLVIGDPLTGYVTVAGDPPFDPQEVAKSEAADRLTAFTEALERLDAVVTGEVGPPNPVAAVEQVLARGTFDEIIVSTLPWAVSRWLRTDLVSRLRRVTAIPVVHIEARD